MHEQLLLCLPDSKLHCALNALATLSSCDFVCLIVSLLLVNYLSHITRPWPQQCPRSTEW